MLYGSFRALRKPLGAFLTHREFPQSPFPQFRIRPIPTASNCPYNIHFLLSGIGLFLDFVWYYLIANPEHGGSGAQIYSIWICRTLLVIPGSCIVRLLLSLVDSLSVLSTQSKGWNPPCFILTGLIPPQQDPPYEKGGEISYIGISCDFRRLSVRAVIGPIDHVTSKSYLAFPPLNGCGVFRY